MDPAEVKRVAEIHSQLDQLAGGEIAEGKLYFVRDTNGQEFAFNARMIAAWPAAKAAMRKVLTGSTYDLVTWNGYTAEPHGAYDIVLRGGGLTAKGMCMYREQLEALLEWRSPEIADLPEGARVRYGHHELKLLSPARISRVSGRFGFVTPVGSAMAKVEFQGAVHESSEIGITEVGVPQ